MREADRAYVWMIVLLVGSYVVCQAIADVGATTMIALGPLVLPGGTFIFAATFTIRDLIHKRLGKEWARAVIVACGAFNIVMAAYLAIIGRLPTPAFFGLGDAWTAIFSIVPAIVVGSIAAEVVSELVDTEVYHYANHLPWMPQWGAVLASNVVSLPLDSLIFGTLAFTVLPVVFGAQSMPFLAAMQLATGQIVWKAIVTVVSLPTIYLVRERTQAREWLQPAASAG